MRIASILAVLATTAVFAVSSSTAHSLDELVAVGNNGRALAWASGSQPSSQDSSSSRDASSSQDASSSGDSSSNDDGSLAADTPTLTPTPTPTPAPAPTPTPTSTTPTVRKVRTVRVHVKYEPLPRMLESLCGAGENEMSVEGVEGVFCVKAGKGCSGDNEWGKCPGRQTNLPHGSYCGRVATGVFGCKPGMPYGTVPNWVDVNGSNSGDGDDGDDSTSSEASGSGSA